MVRCSSVALSVLTAAALAACLCAQQPSNAKAAADGGATSSAWAQFLDRHPGEWISQWRPATGTPRAIYGSGLPIGDWRENTLAEARRHAGKLLAEQAGLLGLGTSEFREANGSRIGRQWSFTFDQYFRGLPVIGGRADVRINMTGRVAMFGSSAWPIPAEFDVKPAIDAGVATSAAWLALGQAPNGVAQPGRAAEPRLVVWGDVEAAQRAPFHLAWEVSVSNVDRNGDGPIGRYYIDAQTGAVLHYRSDKHECGFVGCTAGAPVVETSAPLAAPVNTTVTVMGWTRTGVDANDPVTNVPLPGLVLNVPGIGAVTTDANGQFTINIAAATSITVGQLDGRHHGVISGASAPSGSFTVNPGVASTIQLLTSGATVSAASHTTTSYWCDKVNEYSRGILGNSAELNTADACVPTVNIASTCNAYYTNNTINFYNAGGGCTNTATATIIAHEWGHGLDDRYGGISQTHGLSEGWGDLLAMYLVDDPRVGSGFQTPNVGLRDGNNTYQFGTSSQVHTAGQSWMGFAWKLRDRLATTYSNRATAIAITNDIVVGTIGANATDQLNAVLEVFLADDNDGNLGNGTPNSVDLIWACNQHGLPYPGLPGPANDDCANAIALGNGVSGPYSTVGAYTSSPAWSCANGGSDLWYTYAANAAGTLTVDTCGQAGWDTALEIFSGTCGALTSLACNDDSCGLQSSLSVSVTPGTYYIRAGGYSGATGTFSLNVSGPGGGGGTPASATAYGVGCYRGSKAFYEYFGTAGAFDLGGVGMQLIDGGGYYVAVPGGSYVPPSGAATSLTLTDDSATTVTLSGTFAYPGGTTSSFEVCSNGFVSVATGNGTGYSPSAAGWLGSTQARWGTWHDFNPAIVGSGQVKFEQIGNVAYVTWDGVYSFGTTNPNTFQYQFDLASGSVTYVWPTMNGTGNGWLVGFAAAAPNDDLGSLDITAALPGTFRTFPNNSQGIVLASTLPQLGGTLTLTATSYPAGASLGVQVMSFVQHNPGIDLSSVGMPGCQRFTELESTTVLLPVGGQSVYSMAIPNNPALMGLPLTSQTYAFSPGANAVGVVNSNGVALIVGT